jgi:hypothetical protein
MPDVLLDDVGVDLAGLGKGGESAAERHPASRQELVVARTPCAGETPAVLVTGLRP